MKNTFWAFLFPPVPLVPSVSKSVDHAGQSAGQDAEIFPSDEQLAHSVKRLSQAIARTRLDKEVSMTDVSEAVRLVDASRKSLLVNGKAKKA